MLAKQGNRRLERIQWAFAPYADTDEIHFFNENGNECPCFEDFVEELGSYPAVFLFTFDLRHYDVLIGVSVEGRPDLERAEAIALAGLDRVYPNETVRGVKIVSLGTFFPEESS